MDMSEDSDKPVIVVDTSMTLAKVKVTSASCRVVDHKGKIVKEG